MLRPASNTPATLAVYGAAPGAPAAAFTCSKSRGGQDEACLHLAGELDVATAPHLQRTLQAAQEATPHVVVDLRDVTFIGMAGVRTIAAASERARRAGSRLVVVSGTYAAGVFALTGSCDDVEFRDIDAGRADTPAAVSATARPARYRLPDPSSRAVADVPIAPDEADVPRGFRPVTAADSPVHETGSGPGGLSVAEERSLADRDRAASDHDLAAGVERGACQRSRDIRAGQPASASTTRLIALVDDIETYRHLTPSSPGPPRPLVARPQTMSTAKIASRSTRAGSPCTARVTRGSAAGDR